MISNIFIIDPDYFRPTEVEFLLGDYSKAKRELGWEPNITFDELIKIMIDEDLKGAKQDRLMKEKGFKVYTYQE